MKLNNINNYDVVIVGSGLSGAIIARRYATELNKKVLILEKRNHIGGNVYDLKNDKGLTYHQYGPHIFHTNDDQVINYVKQFAEFNEWRWKVNVNINHKEVPMPINFESIDKLFPERSEEIKNAFKHHFPDKKVVYILDLLKSEDSQIKEIANFVYKNVFENYTVKMWGIPAHEIDKGVLQRVPVRLSYDDGYFDDKFQGAPKLGYTHMVQNILHNPNIHVELNVNATELIKLENGHVYINNHEFKGTLVWTGPLEELVKSNIKLPYRSLNFEFENINKEQFQSRGTVNYPAHPTMTRITEYKVITGEHNKDWTVIGKEYPGQYDPNGNWKERYYPINNPDTADKHKKLLEAIEPYKHHVLISGRLAEYKYKDMWVTIKDALNLKLI